jgi:hypothetical protein
MAAAITKSKLGIVNIVQGEQVRYIGPAVDGLMNGIDGTVRVLRVRAAIVDFGDYGRWKVPGWFMQPVSQRKD